jgi:hypothetical protein
MNSERLELSSESQLVWETLTDKEKRIIQKSYPIKGKRDELIFQLKSKGGKTALLAEISGMSNHHIRKISKRYNISGKEDENNRVLELIKELKQYKEIICLLYKIINA